MRILEGKEKETIYPALFKKCFGYYNDNQIPRFVAIHEREGEPIGFVSGYFVDKETFYFAWGGSVDKFVHSRRQWNDYEKLLNRLGAKWLRTQVHNVDTNWQRVLMKMGWIPHGMTVTNGKLHVQYYKGIGD